MRILKLLSILVLPVLLASCEKVINRKDQASVQAKDNFEYLWRECDCKYAYFDLKKIDWTTIKSKYASRIYDGMSQDSLFAVLGSMMNELRDDHVNLISNFNVSQYGVRFKGPDNFDWRIVEDHYLPKNYHISGPFQHDFIADGQIAYVRFAAFTGTVDTKNLDYILERYQNTKGLILDLRENGGGAVTDVFNLLGRFVKTRTLINYTRIKSGPGHNEFSAEEAVYLEPAGKYYGKKVAVLTDRGTYSAGSFTSLATKALDNMVLIGDTTGGGLGLPNGGQLPNGWTYRFSITQALTLDKKDDYELGVPPDIRVLMDLSDRTKDAVIERAIAELK